MILILPDWVWWAVLMIIGITLGYQVAVYRQDKVTWMDKWFDGPLDFAGIIPAIKKFFRDVKADIDLMRKG